MSIHNIFSKRPGNGFPKPNDEGVLTTTDAIDYEPPVTLREALWWTVPTIGGSGSAYVWALWCAWNWHAVALGAPALSLVRIVGLSVAITTLWGIPRPLQRDVPQNPPRGWFVRSCVNAVGRPLMLVFFMWLTRP